jgi:basic amino acid/polyamine antiporter, APA family
VRQLTASTVNNIVGSGIFALPAAVAAILGPSAIAAYLVCGVAIALVGLCFAEAGSRVSHTGGVYAYSEVAFGPYIGFMIGVLFWCSQVLASAAVASLMVDSVRVLAPALPRTALVVAVYGVLAWINVRGVRPGARLIEIVTVAKLAPLIVLVAAGIVVGHVSNLAWTSAPRIPDLGRASLVLLFAFTGMETALTSGGEVRDPVRTIPRGLLLGLAMVVLLYAGVQLACQGILGNDLAQYETAPLAVAAERAFRGGRVLILLGAIVSTFGYVSGDMLATPRLLFALSRDGFLPARWSEVNPRYRTPAMAIVVHAVVACTLAATGTFRLLAGLSVLTIVIVYLACCLSVFELRRRNVRAEGTVFQAPGGPVVPALACLVVLWLLVHATRTEFLWVGGMVALSSFLYRFRRVNAALEPVV